MSTEMLNEEASGETVINFLSSRAVAGNVLRTAAGPYENQANVKDREFLQVLQERTRRRHKKVSTEYKQAALTDCCLLGWLAVRCYAAYFCRL